MIDQDEKSIFADAIEYEDLARREAFVRSVCGDDRLLLQRVMTLLESHDKPSHPLDRSPVRPSPVRPSPVRPSPVDADTKVTSNPRGDQNVDGTVVDRVGQTIGRYRLIQPIGEGGFGLVYLAEQTEPVRRQVALKILKPGVASSEVLARFDAERQAVAMMDHPNIAKIYDAATTEDGRPYFAMQWVRGEAMTTFCNNRHLSIHDRLRLFCYVCAAAEHAHQKGIIHRDIKPSNVMVAVEDDGPVVKVIDFGVAKAITPDGIDRPFQTRRHSMVGTPLYMSPEQAAMDVDIDTRSDVYSLGVLLYELIAGVTPFDRERLDRCGYDEMRRIITAETPPRPSERMSNAAQVDKPIGAIDPDLDWIVMTAIEKDRDRRYGSAAAFRDDIGRYLNNQPVVARPPSRRYRIGKFVRRHRSAIAGAVVVAASLIGALAVSLYQASVAIEQRDQKEVALRQAIEAKEEVERFAEHLKRANTLMSEARSDEIAGEVADADATLSEAAALVPQYYLAWLQRGSLRASQGQWEDAAEDFAKALELEAPVASRLWDGVAALFWLTGRADEYGTLCRRMIDHDMKSIGHLRPETVRACLVSPEGVNGFDPSSMLSRIGRWTEAWDRRSERPDRAGRFSGRPSGRLSGRRMARLRRPPPPGGEGESGPPRRQDPREVLQTVAAWMQFRAGNDAEAATLLDRVAGDQSPVGATAIALRSMVQKRLGRDDEAAESLAVAKRMAADDSWSGRWSDLVELLVLVREARSSPSFSER